jgi:predicted transposase YdaD
MARPFDATLKELVETYPRDWIAQLGLSAAGPVDVVDADLSTVTAQADKLIRVQEPEPWLLHLELQASRDPHLARRVLKYNVLVFDRDELPVESVVLLLRPEANDPGLTGFLRYQSSRRSSLEFSYDVIRLWERPVDTLLTGGLGTLPLAPLGDVRPEALPGVIRHMDERFTRETAPGEAATLWAATYILMGLRYPSELTAQLLQGVSRMRESSTYQAILAEGRAEEARRLLLLVGGERFGPPDERTRTTLESIDAVERLEQLIQRLLQVSSWEELLVSS